MHERAVIGDADDFSLDAGAEGETLRDRGPGIRKKLLAAKRDAVFFLIELEDLNLNFFAGVDHGGRMGHAAPHEVADVKQAVHTTEVHEDAVVGDVFDLAGDDCALGKAGHEGFALGLLIVFENHAAADDYVAALAIELEDADFNLAILPALEIVDGAQLNLRSRQKGAHTDINDEAALDAFGNLARDIAMLAIGFLDTLPNAAAVGAHVRKEHIAVSLFVETLDFDGLTGAELDGAAGIKKFLRRDQAFKFSTHIHDDARFGDGKHAAIKNFALGGGGSGS